MKATMKASVEKQAARRLNDFQDEVWSSLNAYSKKLGWGLTGIQPECWTLLDGAVDELASLRKQFRITWTQRIGVGASSQEVRGTYFAVRKLWRHLAQETALNYVRDIRVYKGGLEFDPQSKWPNED